MERRGGGGRRIGQLPDAYPGIGDGIVAQDIFIKAGVRRQQGIFLPDEGIALRCAQLDSADPATVRLFAGCGVVGSSNPEDELAESNAKLFPVRDALLA